MIIVTGGTGRLGSQIGDKLLERVPADTIGVSVRDVDKAAGLAARGVRVRAGDFTEPDTLGHAFEGADTVLVVSAAIRGPGAAEANRAALEAAVRAGASRVVYTSHQAASPDSLFPAQLEHAATQDFLAGQGVSVGGAAARFLCQHARDLRTVGSPDRRVAAARRRSLLVDLARRSRRDRRHRPE